MSRKISFMVIISLFITASAFAQYQLDIKIPVFKSVSYFAVAVPGEDDYAIPHTIANNQYYLASVESNRLAMQFFDIGEYEVSASFAQEAIRNAELSDEYVAEQLIFETERLINWTYYNSLIELFPVEYNSSRENYEASLIALSDREWAIAIDSAITSIEILSALQLPPGYVPVAIPPSATPAAIVTQQPVPAAVPLPSQYTVRPWAATRDCLWNIAGYPWVYGDPTRWRELYEANKSRMPQPNNPDLIHPGFVLNIPSIKGEVRQGMWDPNVNYGF